MISNKPKKKVSIDLIQARNNLLHLHNKARAEHGVEPLVLDENLNERAQAWAETVNKNNWGSKHSHEKGVGENMASRWPMTDTSVTDLFNQWYSEKLHYILGPYPKYNTGSGEVGHYTQLMDEKSEKCGFGLAYNEKTTVITLCGKYTPPGNIVGEKPWSEQ